VSGRFSDPLEFLVVTGFYEAKAIPVTVRPTTKNKYANKHTLNFLHPREEMRYDERARGQKT
jgi:hypothetical protein